MSERLSGGQLLVEALIEHGVPRLFCVPGESFLAVLDALYDVPEHLPLITCRHEGGAALMAAATAQPKKQGRRRSARSAPGVENRDDPDREAAERQA